MSKSRGNAIDLKMTEKETAKLIKRAKTDSDRNITYDPFIVQRLPIYSGSYPCVQNQSPEEWAAAIGDGGGGTLKVELATRLNEYLAPIRERRRAYAARPDIVSEVLSIGNRKAREVAQQTLEEVRTVMGMGYGLRP